MRQKILLMKLLFRQLNIALNWRALDETRLRLTADSLAACKAHALYETLLRSAANVAVPVVRRGFATQQDVKIADKMRNV